MTTSTDQIVSLWVERVKAQHPWIAKSRQIRDIYNGDVVVPVPELEENEKVAVANLIQLGIDQTAKRIASSLPRLDCPPTRPNFKQSEDNARLRKNVNAGWWEENKLRTKLRRRARWFVAYTSAPVVIRPDFKNKMPLWVVRDPLYTFPTPSIDPDEITPPDCIFTFARSYGWLSQKYPDQMAVLSKLDRDRSSVYDMIEYTDAEETVLVVVGKPRSKDQYGLADDAALGTAPFVELERYPNRAGICLAVTPGRITLDRPLGMFDGLQGMYQMQAKLMALQVIAAEKNVFPDQWVVSSDNAEAHVVQEADGLTGQLGIVRGGNIVPVHTDPSQTSMIAMDRLEASMRQEGGIPAEYGGQSSSNIRTGRRGASIMSATVDPTIQEAQECFEYSLQEENKRAIAISKAYWGSEKLSVYFGRGTAATRADYTPDRAFDSDQNTVSYAYAGADPSGLIIEIGQRLGMGTMSKKTAMKLDPIIDDFSNEHELVVTEGLEMALMASLDQQAQAGAIPPADIARMIHLIAVEHKSIVEVVEQVQREAQERQANSGPPGAPDGPVAPGSPEAQPGLAPPGIGAEQPAIQGPTDGQSNLMDLLGTMRTTARTGGRPGPEGGVA